METPKIYVVNLNSYNNMKTQGRDVYKRQLMRWGYSLFYGYSLFNSWGLFP